jgi:hypothetical protein
LRRPVAVTRTDWTTAAMVVEAGGVVVVVVDVVVVPVVGVVVLVAGGVVLVVEVVLVVVGVVVLVVVGVVVLVVVPAVVVDVGVVEVVAVEEVVLVDGACTVKPPCIVTGCMSQKNVYEPSEKVTSQLELPVAATPDVWSTPGPCRWNEWKLDMSLTLTVYEPGARVVTALPFRVSEIVKPGPTLASSAGPAAVPFPARYAAAA